MSQAPHVVVVGTDAILGTCLVDLLTGEGYIVCLRRTLTDAGDLLRTSPPALLLVDTCLLRITNTTIRTALQTANVPPIATIVLTTVPKDTISMQDSGIDVVAKPFRLETLLDKVAQYARPLPPDMTGMDGTQ